MTVHINGITISSLVDADRIYLDDSRVNVDEADINEAGLAYSIDAALNSVDADVINGRLFTPSFDDADIKQSRQRP